MSDAFKQVVDWVAAAKPKDSHTYYVGFLAMDRELDRELHRAANAWLLAARGGLVELTQLRIMDEQYVYLATRTTRKWQAGAL